MKNYFTLLVLLLSVGASAQESYSSLVARAEALLEEKEDEINQKKAVSLYEEAFKQYPDSMDVDDLYEVSLLTASLKEVDKAFDYVTKLAKVERNNIGFPGWTYILDEDAKEEYKNLLSDARWEALYKESAKEKEQFDSILKAEETAFFQVKPLALTQVNDGKKLVEEIKNYTPYLAKNKQNYSVQFVVNDTAKTSFYVHLPKNYAPDKRYPVLFFLHGAVRYSRFLDFQTAELNLGSWNRYYTQYADEQDVILVFPRGSKQFNWMTSDAGFFMVPSILKEIKKAINIDDNKVFIAGHSNGATGSFSYLMKQATPYAGFYGFNTYPKVFTGGTFVENIRNRSFMNFSTDEDYYYPPNANDDFTALMKRMKADYQEYCYNGFPHWFPEFDASEPAYQLLFTDLVQRERKAYPTELTWEFDDDAYGSIDWLTQMKVDTLRPKATWHTQVNFPITKWLSYDDNDQLQVEEVQKEAFDFPRKSAKVKATYANNEYRIVSSCVGALSVFISPEMVDLNKKVKIYVNDRLYYNKKVKYNPELIVSNFEETRDRKQIWINRIDLEIN